MELKYNAVVNLTFHVEYFEYFERGMRSDAYGGVCNTLEEAVELWKIAKKRDA